MASLLNFSFHFKRFYDAPIKTNHNLHILEQKLQETYQLLGHPILSNAMNKKSQLILLKAFTKSNLRKTKSWLDLLAKSIVSYTNNILSSMYFNGRKVIWSMFTTFMSIDWTLSCNALARIL